MLSCKFIIWQYGLWSFQMGDIKLDRFLPMNQHTQTKLLSFEFFLCQKSSESFSIFMQNSKFNNFLWVCWFLCKNLSNFVPPLENSTTCIRAMTCIIIRCIPIFQKINSLITSLEYSVKIWSLYFTIQNICRLDAVQDFLFKKPHMH